MVNLLRQLSVYQWIMFAAAAAISALMMMATRVEAASIHAKPLGTTIGHCGWLDAQKPDYDKRTRNVRIIQSKLVAMGYSVGKSGADGLYGKMTRAAVREFQKENDLEVTGKVDGATAATIAFKTHPIRNVQKCQYAHAGRS